MLFLFVGEEGRDEPVLGQVTVPDGVEAVRLDAAIPPEEIAREKERTQARMKALLGDDWVPPTSGRPSPSPSPRRTPRWSRS